GMGTSCLVETSFHEAGDATPDTWPATVQDVSRGGLALCLGRRLERGTVLTIEVRASEELPARALSACVMRVQAQGFGHWLIGCEFQEPLTDAEVQALVQPA